MKDSPLSSGQLAKRFMCLFLFQVNMETDLKYSPFTSSIHPGFWSALTKLKLEVLGLKENALEVHGYYENKFQANLPSLFTLDWDAFEPVPSDPSWCTYRTLGSVINYNTLEAFKNFDKTAYLNEKEGQALFQAMTSEKILEDPRIFTKFVCHMFADLKKYHYYYWFAFPALVLPNSVKLIDDVQDINKVFDNDQVSILSKSYTEWKRNNPIQSGFFWIQTKPELKILSLKEGLGLSEPVVLGFADPSTLPEYPGWPLRNLIAFLGYQKLSWLKQGLQVLCLRQYAKDGQLDISSSKFLNIKCADSNEEFKAQLKVTGWEKNDKNQFAPKFANMKSSMDPKSLAESSVDLNLKLMKWRLVPDLDLVKFSNVKCLLLGSGTLGCNVARCLLGWGVKNITFVDNGKVSYSNPVRQSLFNFEHCLDGGKPKAQSAAETLEKVYPGVKTKGYNLNIPMPGHPISDSTRSKVQEDYNLLENLIKE